MERTLVRQGKATLMVSIPSNWAMINGLKKGSSVRLEPQEGRLVISPAKKPERKKTEISLGSRTESTIRTLITNAYRCGYDIIKVSYANEKMFETLHHIVKTRLIGFDVTRKGEGWCIVEIITEPSERQFENILEKFFLSVKTLVKTTEKRCRNPEAISFNEIEATQERIQSYDNFCRRIMNKQEQLDGKKQFCWAFLALMIHGERELYHANKVLKRGVKIGKECDELLAGIRDLVESLEKAYKKKDITVIERIHKQEKELIYTKGYSLLRKKSGEGAIVLYHLLASIRQFYQANSPLTGMIIG